jgi:hypothetical protein
MLSLLSQLKSSITISKINNQKWATIKIECSKINNGVNRMKVNIIVKIILLSCTFFIFPANTITFGTSIDISQKPVPDYAKWGSLAMKETKAKYPKAEIVDYLHIGKESKPNRSSEKFKLWLVQGTKEFGVYVTIDFDTKTEKVKKISFKETNR